MENQCSQPLQTNKIRFYKCKNQITLSHNGQMYEALMNSNGQIIIPDSEITYNYYYEYNNQVKKFKRTCDVVLDPSSMIISGINENIFTKKWKERTGHHQRAYGVEYGGLNVKLGPFWAFENEITKDFFTGNGIEYMVLNMIDQQSFSIGFNPLPDGEGKKWEIGPFWIELKKNIKVKLI